MMVEYGAKVKVSYSLWVEGEMIDSCTDADPLEYTHGQGNMIPGFEYYLEGMEVGESKTFELEPEQAYGLRDEEAVRNIERETLQVDGEVKVGDILSGSVGQQHFQATIIGVEGSEITVDLNHPLAGKKLKFEAKIIDVTIE